MRGNFTFFSGNKKKDGRGAGPFNPPETTFIQDGPSKMYKGEINWVASNTLFLTARGAHVNGPFTLTPKGGLDNGQVFIDADGVYHNSNTFSGNDRPQVVFNGDGNWFRGRHEVRFGASMRNYKDDQTTRYAGDFLDIQLDAAGTTLAIPIRPYHQVNRAVYSSLYVGDAYSMDRLTLNGSVRYDRATSSVDAITVAAHPVVPSCPAGRQRAGDQERRGVEHAVAARRPDLRDRREPQDHRARQLLGVRQPARRADRRQHLGGQLRLRLLPGRRREPQLQHRAGRAAARFLFAKNILPDEPDQGGQPDRSGLQRAAHA